MAQLSDSAIQDFKKLAKKHRGIDLTDDEAQTLALKWLKLFALVYEPMKEETKDETSKN